MAFPTIASTATTSEINTSQSVNLPATIVSGDALLLFAGIDGSATASATGWTNIYSDPTHSVLKKDSVADGTEDSGTVSVTVTANEKGAWISAAITGWYEDMSAIEAATIAVGANPNSVTASWGADDNLFIACGGCSSGTTVTGYPYADNNQYFATGALGGDGTVAICSDELTTASSDPSAFTSGVALTRTGTLVIRPAGATALTINADHVGSGASIPQPTVSRSEVISADHVPSGAAFYQPTITRDDIQADFVPSGAEVFQPTLAVSPIIEADFVSSGAEVFQPSLSGGADATTGGGIAWFDHWRPTKEEIRKRREEFGVLKPEIDQITRVIKKVSKGQLPPEKAVEQAKDFFQERELTYEPKHEEITQSLVEFLRQQPAFNFKEYAAQKAQEEKERQEHLAIVEAIRAEQKRIEEQDIVFVMMCLAA